MKRSGWSGLDEELFASISLLLGIWSLSPLSLHPLLKALSQNSEQQQEKNVWKRPCLQLPYSSPLTLSSSHIAIHLSSLCMRVPLPPSIQMRLKLSTWKDVYVCVCPVLFLFMFLEGRIEREKFQGRRESQRKPYALRSLIFQRKGASKWLQCNSLGGEWLHLHKHWTQISSLVSPFTSWSCLSLLSFHTHTHKSFSWEKKEVRPRHAVLRNGSPMAKRLLWKWPSSGPIQNLWEGKGSFHLPKNELASEWSTYERSWVFGMNWTTIPLSNCSP